MRRKLNRKGFSVGELLVVVGIILILMAVGFIGIISYQRTMHQLEMDGHAKEIFVAAQNHLALANSQGYLSKTGFGTDDTEETGKGIYYFLVGGAGTDDPNHVNDLNNVLAQVLPLGSVDEAARTGGSYIIRYQKSPAVVLDVFYASRTGRYSHVFTKIANDYKQAIDLVYSGKDGNGNLISKDEKTRKSDCRSCTIGSDSGVVLGYYGGEGAMASLAGDPLDTPTLEIKNEETLRVIVTDPNNKDGSSSPNAGTNSLTLVVKGKDSGAELQLPLVESGAPKTDERFAFSGANDSVVTITLDDVTKETLHFAALEATVGDFIPGEDISVKAVAFNNDKISNIAESGESEVNSLFASVTNEKDELGNAIVAANVAHVRHLLNLDQDVSSLSLGELSNPADQAWQISDLNWSAFLADMYISSQQIVPFDNTKDPGKTGNFYPLNPGYTLKYNGKGHKISNIVVNATETSDPDVSVGLFGTLSGGSVSNLELIDFSLSAKGNVGALAGELHGTTVSGVLVHNAADGSDTTYKVRSSGAAAGGLVGLANGGSVELCAAAVYVRGSGNTGGLIGEAVGSLSIKNSYSGGQTKEAKYLTVTDADYAMAPINVISSGASAGGLVGSVGSDSGTSVSVSYSYSTASASTAVTTASAGAVGGLIGSLNNPTAINNCYAVGLVYAANAPTVQVDPFVASLGGISTSGWGNNWYLAGVSSQSADTTTGYVQCVSSGEEGTGIVLEAGKMAKAVTYDKTLLVNWGGDFNFPTIAQLHDSSIFSGTEAWSTADTFLASFTSQHYGDWQVPSMAPLYFTLENKNTLYSDITLEDKTKYVTLAVQGKTSGQARAFQLRVRDVSGNMLDDAPVTERVGMYDAAGGIIWHDKAEDEIIPDFKLDGMTLTVTLDDITERFGHFSQIFCSLTGTDSAKNLIPGENFTLYVGSGKGTWNELIRIGTPEKGMPMSNNSLFAINETDPASANMSAVGIKLFRHLQNLDYTVSDVDSGVNFATLENDMDWNSTADGKSKYVNIWNTNGRVVSNTFNGIYTCALNEFNGNGKTIKNLVVNGTPDYFTSVAVGNAGLFRYVHSLTGGRLTVKNLTLQDMSVSGSGNVGAVAGGVSSAGSLTVQSVLVKSADKVVASTGSGAAGGLVGLSSGNLTIDNSAAAMFVKTSGDAGGLVGKHDSSYTVKIFASFVGGHTVSGEGKYYVEDNAEGGWNVVSTGSAAGGLLGRLASGTAAFEKSFSAASVWADGKGLAGGVIGVAAGSFSGVTGLSSASGSAPANAALDYVYSVAPVWGVEKTGASNGGLVGSATAAIPNGGYSFYLPEIYSTIDPYSPDGETTNVPSIGSGSFQDTGKIMLASFFKTSDPTIDAIQDDNPTTLEMQTTAYDSALNGKREYPFRMWTKLGGELHYYGDWQPVDSLPTKKLTVHFLTYFPGDESTGGDPVVSSLGTQEVAVQIPYTYKPARVTLPFGTPRYGYDLGSWRIYSGWRDAWGDVGVPAEQVIYGSYDYDRSGESVALPNGVLNSLNFNEDGEKHVTIICSYQTKANSVYKLELWNVNPANPGAVQPVGSYQVLSPTEEKKTMEQLLTEKTIPLMSRSGYRFRGWYLEDQTSESDFFDNDLRVFKTVFDPDKNSFQVVFNDDFTGKDDVVDGNVTLRAWYEPVKMRELRVNFVDAAGLAIPGIQPYVIEFEAERGFSATVILPGDNSEDGLKLESIEGAPRATLDKVNLQAAFEIPPLGETELSDVEDVVYTVKYSGGVKYDGFAVLFELLDTKSSDADDYEAGSTYVYDFHDFSAISSSTALYGRVQKDYLPEGITTSSGGVSSDVENAFRTLQPQGFTFSGNVEILQFDHENQDTSDDLPANSPYRGKYAESVTVNVDGTDYTHKVKTLVVVQYERREYDLSFDTKGSRNSFRTVPYVYGKKLSEILNDGKHTPSYNGFEFDYWSYQNPSTGREVRVDGDTTMPARNLTLKAHRSGAPVEFVLAIWLQDPDNENVYTLGKYYEKYEADGVYNYSANENVENAKPDLKGNADSTVTVTYSKAAAADDDESVVTLAWESGEDELTCVYDISQVVEDIRFFHLSDRAGHISDTSVEIAGNGSTVVNVYFDRNEYALWFFLGRARYASLTEGGVFDTAERTHPLTEFTAEDGTSFWAYEDPSGAPYGKNALNRYFHVEPYPVDAYRWVNTFSAENSDTHSTTTQYYGIVGGKYVPLTQTASITYRFTSQTYGYKEVNNDNDNNPYKYGIFGNSVQRVYWNNKSFREKDNKNATVYNGTVYQRTTRGYNTSTTYNGTALYYIVNGGFSTDKSQATAANQEKPYGRDTDDYLYPLTVRSSTYTYTDPSGNAYTGTRYKSNGTPGTTSFTLEQLTDVDGDGKLWRKDGNNAWVEVEKYGTTTGYRRLDNKEPYTGDVKFLIVVENPVTLTEQFTTTSDTQYWVASQSGTDSQNFVNNWGTSDKRRVKTTTNLPNPFAGKYNKLVNYKSGNETFVDFYYVIRARYAQDIQSRWPDLDWMGGVTTDTLGYLTLYDSTTNFGSTATTTNSSFISWIAQSDSLYYQNWQDSQAKSIKGKYASMSEELICKNASNGYRDTPDTAGTLATAAHVFQGRHRSYNDTFRYHYQFYFMETTDDIEWRFFDDTLNDKQASEYIYLNTYSTTNHGRTTDHYNPADHPHQGITTITPEGGYPVTSNGQPYNQHSIEFYGYDFVGKWTSIQNGSANDYKTYSDINFYYRPHRGYVELWLINEKEGVKEKLTDDVFCYYGQSLSSLAGYADDVDVPVGSKVKGNGWFRDPNGLDAVDMTALTMPDTVETGGHDVGLKLYYVLEPTDKMITLKSAVPDDCPQGTVVYWDDGDDNDENDVPMEETSFGPVTYGTTLQKYLNDRAISWTDYNCKDIPGYTFGGWGYYDDKGVQIPFYIDDAVEDDYDLYPIWDEIEVPQTVTVWIRHLDGETEREVHTATSQEVTIGQRAEFVALTVSGYRPVNPLGKMTVASVTPEWLESKYNTERNRYEVILKYKTYSMLTSYELEYYLFLRSADGSADLANIRIDMPEADSRGQLNDLYGFVAFYTLPESLPNYKLEKLELYQNGTKIDETTDPILFLNKGENQVVKVYVSPDVNPNAQFTYVTTYTGLPQGINVSDLGELPQLPDGVSSMATINVACRYYNAAGVEITTNEGLSTQPTNAGIYGVQVRMLVQYEGKSFLFWQSEATEGRYSGTFYINRCDVVLTSGSVLDKFHSAYTGTLPEGCSKSDLAKAHSVTVTVPDGVIAPTLTYTYSADAFRREKSNTVDQYTTNVFDYTATDVQQQNFNFYKQYGRLYLWNSLDAYNAYVNP